MTKLFNYFKTVWVEIKKVIKPEPEKLLTLDEIKTELKSKNKNELINILIKHGSDLDRTLPLVPNRKELKQAYSKNKIIDAICLLLYEKYKIEGKQNERSKKADRSQAQSESCNTSPAGIL